MKTNLLRILAIVTLAFAVIATMAGALPVALIAVFVAASVIAGPSAYMRGQLGAAPDTNDVASELNLNEILDASIKAFKRAILPVTVLSTVFRNVILKGTNKVEVPYYPLQGADSKDFNGSYAFDTGAGSSTGTREVTINKRKYQPLALTGAELSRIPTLNAQTLGEMKGEKLAFDVIQDILSVVTAANFGAAAFTGAASGFDSDDVIDLRTAANTNAVGGVNSPWPETGRGLLLNPAYDGALLKDHVFSQAYSIGTAQAIQEGKLPRIFGFNYGQSAAIPANGENLVGFAVYMSAILAAFSPIEPPEAVKQRLTQYEVVTDPDTGISIEYRVWGDPDSDTEKRVLECNYGYAKGEAAALKRLVSA